MLIVHSLAIVSLCSYGLSLTVRMIVRGLVLFVRQIAALTTKQSLAVHKFAPNCFVLFLLTNRDIKLNFTTIGDSLLFVFINVELLPNEFCAIVKHLRVMTPSAFHTLLELDLI